MKIKINKNMEYQYIPNEELERLVSMWKELRASGEVPAINAYFDAVNQASTDYDIEPPEPNANLYRLGKIPLDWVIQMHMYWSLMNPDRMRILRENEIFMANKSRRRKSHLRIGKTAEQTTYAEQNV